MQTSKTQTVIAGETWRKRLPSQGFPFENDSHPKCGQNMGNQHISDSIGIDLAWWLGMQKSQSTFDFGSPQDFIWASSKPYRKAFRGMEGIKVTKCSFVIVIFWKSIQIHTQPYHGHILGIGKVVSYICCVGWTKDKHSGLVLKHWFVWNIMACVSWCCWLGEDTLFHLHQLNALITCDILMLNSGGVFKKSAYELMNWHF